MRVAVENVPLFNIDLGFSINKWHRDNDQPPNVEPFETQVFVELLSNAPRVLDIGANAGWYSCIAASCNSGSMVHAFEPEPANFTLLARNLGINGFHRVWPHQIALGAKDGIVDLFLSNENLGDHRIASTAGRESIGVGIAKLDTVLHNFIPDLVKIDVQGAELQVFEGAQETFRRAGGNLAMCIEFQPEALGLEVAHELAERIFAFGRPVFVIHPYEGNQLQPLKLEVLHDAIEGCMHPRFDVHSDLVIAPQDSRFERLRKWIGRDWAQWAY
jgi:FkbM family methyltransferase